MVMGNSINTHRIIIFRLFERLKLGQEYFSFGLEVGELGLVHGLVESLHLGALGQ
jgi:hypothetical protein